MSVHPSVKKKPVHVTTLTLQFYEQDGWTYDTLKKYIVSGNFIRGGDPENRFRPVFWMPEFMSTIDYDAMYNEGHVSSLLDKRLLWEISYMSDLDAMKAKG